MSGAAVNPRQLLSTEIHQATWTQSTWPKIGRFLSELGALAIAQVPEAKDRARLTPALAGLLNADIAKGCLAGLPSPTFFGEHIWDQTPAYLAAWGLKKALNTPNYDSIENAVTILRKATKLTSDDLLRIWTEVAQ